MNRVKDLLHNKTWLAPLAGFTESPFRIVCKENGADVMVTEMTSVDGLVYDFSKSISYAVIEDSERPIGIQLFGSNPELMTQAVEKILPFNPDFLNINMGCPVKKVIKKGAGSALMLNRNLSSEIVKAVKGPLKGTGIPVSVKIRSGWDFNSINAVDFSLAMEDAGADFIILHPRTRSQMYSGLSDWSLIKIVKSRVKIPVVGNGDIRTIADGVKMFAETGCDSIMIGRGALGQPWIFSELKSYLLTKEIRPLDYEDRFRVIERHTNLTIDLKGEERGMIEMRAHFCCYTKGMIGGNKVREQIMRMEDKSTVLELVSNLYGQQRDKDHNYSGKA